MRVIQGHCHGTPDFPPRRDGDVFRNERAAAERLDARIDAARDRADQARAQAEEAAARLRGLEHPSCGPLVTGLPPRPQPHFPPPPPEPCLVRTGPKADNRNPPSIPLDPPPQFPRPPRPEEPSGTPPNDGTPPVDGTAPTSPTSPSTGAGGGRAVQSDTLDPQGQAAIEQTLGGPLREGENTLDSVPNHSDIDDLDLPLSANAERAVMDQRYNGRMITENGTSYAFTFEEAIGQSAQRLGVPEAELLSMIQAEEAGHAAAASRYPGLSSSDNEVIGEAVSSRVSPRAQTLTALSDLVLDGQGLLDSRYDQCSTIARQAIADTLGPGGDADAFMRSFSAKYGAGQTGADALAGVAAEMAPDDPAGFVSRLEANMATAFQNAAAGIVQEQGGGQAAAA